MKPKHKLHATLCNNCDVVISNTHTDHVLCNKCLEDYVHTYPTKSTYGFNQFELFSIMNEFPNLNVEKFDLAMMGNTGIVEDGLFITYFWDVVAALRCGIENRDLRLSEWD